MLAVLLYYKLLHYFALSKMSLKQSLLYMFLLQQIFNVAKTSSSVQKRIKVLRSFSPCCYSCCFHFQKQPFADVLQNSVLKDFARIHRKNNCVGVSDLMKLLKKRLQHRCFPVNFAKFLKAPILKNTSGLLLLRFEKGVIQ